VEHADSAPRDDDGGVGGSGKPLKMALRNPRAAHRGTPASLAAFFSGAGSDFAAAATLETRARHSWSTRRVGEARRGSTVRPWSRRRRLAATIAPRRGDGTRPWPRERACAATSTRGCAPSKRRHRGATPWPRRGGEGEKGGGAHMLVNGSRMANPTECHI